MTIYLNYKGAYGRETVDEFSPEPDQTNKGFRQYVRSMIQEYNLAGMNVYKSSRPCSNWSTN